MKFSALLGGIGLLSAYNPTSMSNTYMQRQVLRKQSMLMSPPGHPTLPQPNEVSSNINITNIQAEILLGMKQKAESFLFFSITDPAAFKQRMSKLITQITTVDLMLTTASQPPTLMNVGLSQSGLHALGIMDHLNDTAFTSGQFATAPLLSEHTDTWVPQFKGTNINGVFMIASDNPNFISGQAQSVKNTLGSSIAVLYTAQGQARPGDQEGHEHFGFLDGVSQPAVQGFGTPFPGQLVVQPGVTLIGGEGDSFTRPAWAKDGSFMAFRQLKQLVPEFNKFGSDHPATIPGMPKDQAAELTLARLIGRWKSGAPIDLAPVFDDPQLGADPMRNNNFNFTHAGMNISSDQSRCPFSAHIRKNVPRTDLTPEDKKHLIMRSGIPYGPEVTQEEQEQQRTIEERGLHFTCFQSSLTTGFQFLQKTWMNNVNFVGGKSLTPGFDPLIGQNNGSARWTMGLDPMDTTGNTTLPIQFVVSRGGEHFYIPSITAMTHIINS